MELTQFERLALYEAINKRLNDKKDGLLTEAKETARQNVLEAYDAFGADRAAIIVNGQKVGEVGLSFAKPRPVIKSELMNEAMEYLDGLGLVDRTPARGWESHFVEVNGGVLCKDTGELVDWAFVEPGRVKGASVRGCKPEDVLGAIAPMIGGGSVLALLEA